MPQDDFIDLCVADIMSRWPATIAVFIDLEMHCVGCPIGTFHTLYEAADEHGIVLAELIVQIEDAIAGRRPRAALAELRPRSAPTDADP